MIRWVGFIAICLHPFLLDFSVAARGYSLSLAFFLWATYFSARRRYVLAGVLLGLAASANLAITFPALGLMLAVVLLASGSLAQRLRASIQMAMPAAALLFIICFASLLTARRESFYVGHDSFRDGLSTLIYRCIRAKLDQEGLFGTWEAAKMIETFLLPPLFLFILVVSAREFLRRPGDRQRFIPLVTLLATIPGLTAAHYWFGLKYPPDRAWLYVVLLFGIAWAIAADAAPNRALRGVHLALASLLAVQFASQFQTRHFWSWTWERENKTVAKMLQKECAGKPANTVAVSTTWDHQPALEFYREYFRITALQPIERREPTPLSGYDFYVLSGSDAKEVERAQLRVLFEDPPARLVLAVPRKR